MNKVTPEKPARGYQGHYYCHPQTEDDNFTPLKDPGTDKVDRTSYKLGYGNLRGIYNNKADKPANVTPAITDKIRQE
jgi:hypothetical protein